MNFRILGRTVGYILLIELGCMLLSAFVSLLCRETPFPFLISAVIMFVVGFPLSRIKPDTRNYFARDGFTSVALAWIIASLFGSLPFLFCGHFGSWVNCLFETVSGFTTTGASILSDIESLPKGILFWRSFTHFLGGMGILVLMNAIFAKDGERAQFLMQAEVPGPTSDKLVPKLSDSSKILYTIYGTLTVIQIICLLIAGLPLYDAVNVALSTSGTGGFSVLNDSILGYGNTAVDIITTVFMVIFSLNFALYFLIITGKWRQALKSEELRIFLLIILCASVLIIFNTAERYSNIFECMRATFFTVAATISSTGFAVADYDVWPTFSKVIIFILMLTGACAGSTGGGIKTSRSIIMCKSITREIKQLIHPRSVNIVTIDKRTVSERTLSNTMRFFAAYCVISLLSTILISIDGYDLTTTVSAVITCMSNIGPGFELVGPTCNFAFFSDFSKIILSLTMIIGRLEIFPILILFAPSTWRRS